MKIEVDGINYFLEFRHSYKLMGLVNKPYATEAIIFKDDVKPENIVTAAVARCHPNDQFDRAKGRKYALTKALEPLLDPTDVRDFTKDQRRQIWEAYLNR